MCGNNLRLAQVYAPRGLILLPAMGQILPSEEQTHGPQAWCSRSTWALTTVIIDLRGWMVPQELHPINHLERESNAQLTSPIR